MRRRALAILLSALTAVGLVASGATASTGGTPDRDNAYGNVAFLIGYDASGARARCSGALVSPTVVLTAGHCTDGSVGRVLVTFEPVLPEQSPAPFPTAADPSSGYTTDEVTGAGHLAGTAATHPSYDGLTDLKNWNDVGVVVLDAPVAGVVPASLAPLGRLDRIRTSDLSKTLFRAVGYGTEVRKPESGPQKPTAETYPLLRRYVDMPGQKLTSQVLQTNGTLQDGKGGGGTCTGDSGGPVLLDGAVVALTSYSTSSSGNCRSVSGYQRVDVASARDWLATVTG